MSVLIRIHHLDENGVRDETYTYGRIVATKLEDIRDFKQLVASPQFFQTGFGARITEKRLIEILKQFGRFETERVQGEGHTGLTAYSRVGHGAVPPTKVRGG